MAQCHELGVIVQTYHRFSDRLIFWGMARISEFVVTILGPSNLPFILGKRQD